MIISMFLGVVIEIKGKLAEHGGEYWRVRGDETSEDE